MKDACLRDKQRSKELSTTLRAIYEPHFLRRTKNQIFKVVSAELLGRPLLNNELPLKCDLVVWLPLSKEQESIYRFMLDNQTLQNLIEERQIQSAFFILSYIKKLCLHPFLLASTSKEKKR